MRDRLFEFIGPMHSAGHGFRKFGAWLPGVPSSQRQALSVLRTVLKQIVLSTTIPWDFDHSESETERRIPCLYLSCCSYPKFGSNNADTC